MGLTADIAASEKLNVVRLMRRAAMAFFGLVLAVAHCAAASAVLPAGLRAQASLVLEDRENKGVVARITLRNQSAVSLCIPQRFLEVDPWPFVVTDEAGHNVPPIQEMESDTFGSYTEAFYIVGPGKTLKRSLFLRGHINVPAGHSYTFDWTAEAHDCNDVAMVSGFFDDVEKLRSVRLHAEGQLPSQPSR